MPFARIVISSVWTDPGATVAPGRSAVTVRGGIQPVAAQAPGGTSAPSRKSGTRNRARDRWRIRTFLEGKEAGAGLISGPPLPLIANPELLENRDSDLLRELAGIDTGVVMTRRDAASRVIRSIPHRDVRSGRLITIHERANETAVHVADPELHSIARPTAPREHIDHLRKRVGRIGPGVLEREAAFTHDVPCPARERCRRGHVRTQAGCWSEWEARWPDPPRAFRSAHPDPRRTS